MGDGSERAAPSSGELTSSIAKKFDISLKETSTLRGVASLAISKRDPSTVKKFVVDLIRARCGAPLKAHRALARVAPTMVMTTNYDDLYEAAMREAGKPLEKVVRAEQLPRLPHDRPRVLKLHGDVERADEVVLTSQDYREWQREAGGLKAEVVATLQKSVCVFVGYGVGDENLHEILNIIEGNLGSRSLKHFALVRDVDDELGAQWKGTVEFVQGDATEFFERLAIEHTALVSRPVRAAQERADFQHRLEAGDLTGAGEICERLVHHHKERGERAMAGSLWLTFGGAARDSDEHGAAAAAFKEAGELFLEASYFLDAEPALSEALSEAVGESALEREIQPLLQKARLLTGRYDKVLSDAERALKAHGADAPASLVYALRMARAEAREATEGLDGAREEMEVALGELPTDALYFRTRAGADLARIFSDKFDWKAAHTVLDTVEAEISNAQEDDPDELSRCAAVQKLARANVHLAVGEDAHAAMHYRECASVLEELGEMALAVSAMQGMVASASFLGDPAGDDTQARLRDLARAPGEHRRNVNLQRQGIEQLADGKLAAARNSLVQAEAAANAVHSPVRRSSVRGWFAKVLLEAGFEEEALLHYVEVGERKEVEGIAGRLAAETPPQGGVSLPEFEQLLVLGTKGPMASRGAALIALAQLWHVLPDDMLPDIVDLLARLHEMPSSMWADRNVISDAADLAEALAPRFTQEQAERVGAALVDAINTDGFFWGAYKSACLALARLSRTHPPVVGKLVVPTDRLGQMVGGDVLADTMKAMVALVNLALGGHAEAKEKALNVLEGADTFSRASWRQVLGEASEEELAEATRELLPRSVSRVKSTGDGSILSIGTISPMFLWRWDLPESVRSAVACTLTEALTDPAATLTHRQSAALVLGSKAEQFGEQDQAMIVEALMSVLTEAFEADPMVVSITNPLSMLRSNVGEAEDVLAAAVEALLAFSPGFDDGEKRRSMRREVEKLRASQVEALGRGVARGLNRFAPEDNEESRWLHTRLLLLLNSQHPMVRQDAARNLPALLERAAVAFDPELLDVVLQLSVVDVVGDREAAAYALSKMEKISEWHRAPVTEALKRLRHDASYLVRLKIGPLP